MPDHPNPQNGWYEYQRLVLHELDRGEKERTEIENKIVELQRELSDKISMVHDDVITLKVKASLWGAFAGASITIVFAILELVSR